MSKDFDKTNTGIISKNKRKETEKHPDITGSINVEGREYWLNGWEKQGREGRFYSLAVKPKEQQSKPAPGPKRPQHDDMDGDEIPF